MDSFIVRLWAAETGPQPRLVQGVVLTAIGGYGRGMLFPYSDVDILVCTDKAVASLAGPAIQRLIQNMWDCGFRVAATQRLPGECERFDPENPEFCIALLDLRFIVGDRELFARLHDRSVARMRRRDSKALVAAIARVARERHDRFGNTLFHMEPDVKDAPGGLRDVNTAQWLASLRPNPSPPSAELEQALAFLAAVRCFLHYRHGRDDNGLDWVAQDAAAAARVGLPSERPAPDSSLWMRAYFRHARLVERALITEADHHGVAVLAAPAPRKLRLPAGSPFRQVAGRLELNGPAAAQEPEIVLALFAASAKTGSRLTPATEEQIANAIPVLSVYLEEGPGLWQALKAVLTGDYAGLALRSMHALGVLELLLPEFHGIDALVIRDAYHRYTVDEHTFVVLDVLHELQRPAAEESTAWQQRFRSLAAELQAPELLYLAALLHDTGKGRAVENHALAAAEIARSVLSRLELEAHEAALVVQLLEVHLEMSTALRRDIFDADTLARLSARVPTHELLRMLTLFTYADIAAVHPNSLTPWKQENLWKLFTAAANYLSVGVDDSSGQDNRFAAKSGAGLLSSQSALLLHREKFERIVNLIGEPSGVVEAFLEGFPERYLSICSPEEVVAHFRMSRTVHKEYVEIQLHRATVSEVTLVTVDRPRLFVKMAAALAFWGMDVISAEAFANAHGIVVDTFRFTDKYRALELNPAEQERFLSDIRSLILGERPLEEFSNQAFRGGAKRAKRSIQTVIEMDNTASAESTVIQVRASNSPGLLRTLSSTLSQTECDVRIALIDTEGDTAIDVFYVTAGGKKLDARSQEWLAQKLRSAIEANSSSYSGAPFTGQGRR